MTLVTPEEVEDLCIGILRRRHTEHLALLERQKGLVARTIEPLRTIDVLTRDGIRLRDDKPPACLLGIFNVAKPPVRHGRDQTLEFEWALYAQIAVVGTNRRDVMKRRGWYAMVVAECLLNRVPRNTPPVDALELIDVDFTTGTTTEKSPRAVGEAQLTFTVTCQQTLDLEVLPPDNTPFEPGAPWGPPTDPYTPPAADPTVAAGYPQADVHREGDPTQ